MPRPFLLLATKVATGITFLWRGLNLLPSDEVLHFMTSLDEELGDDGPMTFGWFFFRNKRWIRAIR